MLYASELFFLSVTVGFGDFPSISGTVNKTVMVECNSNCTPIRILHIVGDSEDEVDPQMARTVTNESHPYVTIAAIHLDLTYNDTYLVCKAVYEPSQPSTDLAQILLQGTHTVPGYVSIRSDYVCILIQISYSLLRI